MFVSTTKLFLSLLLFCWCLLPLVFWLYRSNDILWRSSHSLKSFQTFFASIVVEWKNIFKWKFEGNIWISSTRRIFFLSRIMIWLNDDNREEEEKKTVFYARTHKQFVLCHTIKWYTIAMHRSEVNNEQRTTEKKFK